MIGTLTVPRIRRGARWIGCRRPLVNAVVTGRVAPWANIQAKHVLITTFRVPSRWAADDQSAAPFLPPSDDSKAVLFPGRLQCGY